MFDCPTCHEPIYNIRGAIADMVKLKARAEDAERKLASAVRDEWLRLVPLFCGFCKLGDLLVRPFGGGYAHRDPSIEFVSPCLASPLHTLLKTDAMKLF